MDLIISGMFVWLALTIVSGAYMIFSQVSRMKRLNGGIDLASSLAQGKDLKTSTQNAAGSMISGLGWTVFAGFIATVCGVLFLVAVAGKLLG
ncbi:hypothetical protein LCGC14_0702160 [marine sediment metagenome]|uniref:Uncharacterized protein n=1 Tax=marine sediment metagenome TaxID=412755 RepID=A0A0F9QM88_9ZZZZ